MKTIMLKRRESVFKKGVAVNLSGVCFLFVALCLILSILLLYSSINEDEKESITRGEELASVGATMRGIAGALDNGNIARAITESFYVRASGMLGAVSEENRRKIYEFLSDISSAQESEYPRYAAYARSCAACALCELTGSYCNLDEWKSNDDSFSSLSTKSAIRIAKSNSLTGLYPGISYYDRTVCAYASNYYKSFDYTDLREYVYLTDNIDFSFDDSCDIDMLKKQVISKILYDDKSSEDLKYMFSEMGIAFFRLNKETYSITVGITMDGSQTYLYCHESTDSDVK